MRRADPHPRSYGTGGCDPQRALREPGGPTIAFSGGAGQWLAAAIRKWQFWAVVGPAVLLTAFLVYPANKPPSFLNVSVGNRPVEGVDESGFNMQETDRNNSLYRWTDGRARLVIPVERGKPPQVLHVVLQSYRARQIPRASVRIVLNNQELFNGQIDARSEHDFPLAGLDLGDRAVLEILSDSFVPSNVPGANNNDQRTLGVQVFGVQFLSSG
jgi:hypothetical protein